MKGVERSRDYQYIQNDYLFIQWHLGTVGNYEEEICRAADQMLTYHYGMNTSWTQIFGSNSNVWKEGGILLILITFISHEHQIEERIYSSCLF